MSRLPSSVRIGIVEDDSVLGESLAATVSALSRFVLVGVSETLADGRALVARGLDVLLLDLALPDGSGLDLIRAASDGECKVLVVSVFGDARNVVRAIELGADGYVLKGADSREVASAIETVLAGGAPISPSVAAHILARVRKGSGGLTPALKTPVPARPPRAGATLTPRELVVLELLAKGLSYKDVADLVGISYNTVADHVKAIYRKLAVSSRGEAVFEAVQAGLITIRA